MIVFFPNINRFYIRDDGKNIYNESIVEKIYLFQNKLYLHKEVKAHITNVNISCDIECFSLKFKGKQLRNLNIFG